MGCDIHLFIEVKTGNGWELYSRCQIERNYDLFAKMANVRNYSKIIPISTPKGLPDDISYIIKKSYGKWKCDAHSESYLDSKEIVELSEWLENYKPYGDKRIMGNDLEYGVLKCYLEGISFAGFYKYPNEKPDWIFDFRFIFWFDN